MSEYISEEEPCYKVCQDPDFTWWYQSWPVSGTFRQLSRQMKSRMFLVEPAEVLSSPFWSLPGLVSKFRKKRTPPNLPCQIQIRTRKKERSSSVISWQRRLVSKNRKRRTTHNLPCRVQLRTQKMERSSSIISWQWRLISKNSKRHTLPDLPCRVQVRTRKMERSSRTF